MKKCIMLMVIASLLFAVQTVPRGQKTGSDNKTRIESINKGKPNYVAKKSSKSKGHDRFEDADSNSVNDNREDDFQKIKNLNSKFKDKYKIKNTPKNKKNTKGNPQKKNTK